MKSKAPLAVCLAMCLCALVVTEKSAISAAIFLQTAVLCLIWYEVQS